MHALTAHRAALARAIRELRDERGLSSGELAARAGLDAAALATIESAEPGADFASLVRLARALGVPLSTLVDRYEGRLAELGS